MRRKRTRKSNCPTSSSSSGNFEHAFELLTPHKARMDVWRASMNIRGGASVVKPLEKRDKCM